MFCATIALETPYVDTDVMERVTELPGVIRSRLLLLSLRLFVCRTLGGLRQRCMRLT